MRNATISDFVQICCMRLGLLWIFTTFMVACGFGKYLRNPVCASGHVLLRFRMFSTLSSPSSGTEKKRVVFLGSPTVAAETLQTLFEASKATANVFDIVAVVAQPPADLKKKLKPNAVHVLAQKLQLPVLIPESAKDPAFLETLAALNVDLCITAAYGNFLPKKFLAIPKFGTVNIHPSLLPLYRGAAPVQRCLEHGDASTGVSVAFTVLKMDAGPVIKQVPYLLTGNEKAPQVLSDCFRLGTAALLEALPAIFDKTVQTTLQIDENATHAPKLTPQDARVDFASMNALVIHNKCRGFAEWPGVVANFTVGSKSSEPVELKLFTTCVIDSKPSAQRTNEVVTVKHTYEGKSVNMLKVICADGSALGIIEVLPPARKVMPVKDFLNGYRGDTAMKWRAVESEAAMPQ